MNDKLTIQLVPCSHSGREEVTHIHQLFSSEGVPVNVSSSVYLRKAADTPPTILMVIIVPFAWFAKGFFTRMGEGTWKGIEQGLKKAHNYLRERYNEDPNKELCFMHQDLRIGISLPREDDERLSEALQKLPEYLESGIGEEASCLRTLHP